MRVRHWKTTTNHREGNSEEDPLHIFNISKYFQKYPSRDTVPLRVKKTQATVVSLRKVENKTKNAIRQRKIPTSL